MTDNFTLSALAGHGEFSRSQRLRTASWPGGLVRRQPAACRPRAARSIVDARPGYRRDVTGTYCSTCNLTDGFRSTAPTRATSATSSASTPNGSWATHLLRFGYDVDNYTSVAGQSIEGGRQWRYSTVNPDGIADAATSSTVREQIVNQGSSNEVKQRAFYVEDAWNITDNFIAYVGLRWDTSRTSTASGQHVRQDREPVRPAPGLLVGRLGDSSFKVSVTPAATRCR